VRTPAGRRQHARRGGKPGLHAGSFRLLLPAAFLARAAAGIPELDDIPPLRPPRAELPPTFWEQSGLWVITAGFLLLALAGAAIWFLTRPRPPQAVPPEAQARQALEPLCHQPEDGALLSRVSQVLRHYVQAAFALPPEEMTTAEFCRAVAGHAAIGPELSTALAEFLRACDQYKFSPPAPAPPLDAVSRALQLVEQAEARRAPPRPDGAAPAAAGQPAA